jgi:hypothetical protein
MPNRKELLYRLAVFLLRFGVRTLASQSILDFDLKKESQVTCLKKIVCDFTEGMTEEHNPRFGGPAVECFLKCVEKNSDCEDSFKKVLWTVLSVAIECGHLERLECLVRKMLEAPVVDQDGNTPLHLAVKMYNTYGELKVIRSIIN